MPLPMPKPAPGLLGKYYKLHHSDVMINIIFGNDIADGIVEAYKAVKTTGEGERPREVFSKCRRYDRALSPL